ncbi:MAG TPA: hypothetical protein DIT89_16420 [Planctomycetaceae bacterium]|nr:hypothetical protein [Planctomycetaceae bacterium]
MFWRSRIEHQFAEQCGRDAVNCEQAKLLQKLPKSFQNILISYAGKALRKARLNRVQKRQTLV